MNREALLALVLLLGSVPLASAEHLSAGVQDGVLAAEADEMPQAPSVPGQVKGANDTPYGVATRLDCFDPDGEPNASKARRSTRGDGLCGELVYHEDVPELTVRSPPDQDLHEPVERFDVVHTNSYRTRTATSVTRDATLLLGLEDPFCLPMCPSGHSVQPVGGDRVFDAFHTAGDELGLTENASEARGDAHPDRTQEYGINTYASGPGRIVQDETDAWRMNGWMMPAVEDTWVAFLEEDADSTPAVGDDLPAITDEELEVIVEAREGESLHEPSHPEVCLYSPDLQLETVSPGYDNRCELEFGFRGTDGGEVPGEGEEADFEDGYESRCDSPAYVCGAAMGPAWYSEFCVCFGGVTGGSDAGQAGYYQWHAVVAPHDSRCAGSVEPTAALSDPGDGTNPYLAHDVDIYTPVTDARTTPGLRSVDHTTDYAAGLPTEAADAGEERTGTAVESRPSAVPGLPGGGDEQARHAALLAAGDDDVEPTNAEPVGGLDDTSQTREAGPALERSVSRPCEELWSSETPATRDPWVDYIDARPVHAADGSPFDEQVEGETEAGIPYRTEGYLGMFADVDDDGRYDRLPEHEKYEFPEIHRNGAYPMVWEMWLTPDGSPDPEAGCSTTVGPSLVQEATELGYGPNTGLVQAVYLTEPTVFGAYDATTEPTAAYPDGNNVYLLMNQAARVQHERGGNPLADEIDRLVDAVETYADAENGELPPPEVRLPAREMGLEAAFVGQCEGPTGDFGSRVQFLHQCATGCRGDTIATMYTFQLEDGTLDGTSLLSPFQPQRGEAYDFGAGQHTWIDVDPLDGDPSRHRNASSAPPT